MLLVFMLGLLAFVPTVAGQGIRQAESRYYRVHSDLPADLTQQLGRELDAMFDEYARRFASFGVPARAEKFAVHLFESRDAYRAFVGEHNQHSGGIYLPQRKTLAAYLGDRGRDELRRTLRHEAFHQFADIVIGPTMPVWLNEGLAQLFEEGYWRGGTFVMGQVPPHRLRHWHNDTRRGVMPSFSEIADRSHEDWHANMSSVDAAGTQYNLAWAAAHFFVYGTAADGTPLLRERLIYMLKLLHAGYDADESLRRSVGEPGPALDRALQLYMITLRPGETALTLEAQRVRGDMLKRLWTDGRRFDRLGAFRDFAVKRGYRLEYTENALRWITAEDPSCYFADPRGRPLPDSLLFFDAPNPRRPLPDLVCRTNAAEVRTRFTLTRAGTIDAETIVRPR